MTIKLLLLSISVLYSCKENLDSEKATVQEMLTESIAEIPEEKVEEVVIRELPENMKIFNGSWYEVSYIEQLKKSKSPYHSQDYYKVFVVLDIDINRINGDSIEVNAFNIHEGAFFYMYTHSGIENNSFRVSLNNYENQSGFYELGYIINDTDTSLVMYDYNGKEELTDRIVFRKCPENNTDGFFYKVNEAILSGDYQLLNKNFGSKKVMFTNKGEVIGLPGFSKYEILTDFVAGAEVALDEIIFDRRTSNKTAYSYRINKDTLMLYSIIENEAKDTLSLGALEYILLKQL